MYVVPDYEKLCKILEAFEGYDAGAYKDSGGVWTIGYGSTFNYDKNRKVKDGDVVSRTTAMRFMERDLQSVVRQLNMYITQPLSPDQSAALVDYVYNRGIRNFLRTRLDELINANPFDERIKDEFLGTGLWDRAGNKLWGLGRRRRAEYYLYSTGLLKFDWQRW